MICPPPILHHIAHHAHRGARRAIRRAIRQHAHQAIAVGGSIVCAAIPPAVVFMAPPSVAPVEVRAPQSVDVPQDIPEPGALAVLVGGVVALVVVRGRGR